MAHLPEQRVTLGSILCIPRSSVRHQHGRDDDNVIVETHWGVVPLCSSAWSLLKCCSMVSVAVDVLADSSFGVLVGPRGQRLDCGDSADKQTDTMTSS